MKPILELKNVSKSIGKKKIIDNLSFTINSGEIFGFLGPNGAGKTTTIKMITGLISIGEGEIIIDGYNVKTDFEKALSNVGGIVENPEMYGYMSGTKNLKYYAKMHDGITQERINEVVKLVKLDNRINEKVKRYSLGMRQRLGVAQAILHNPKLIILDEPTNGLDPMGIKELRETLRNLTEQGSSVIVSSHLLSEMELMCDRFCIIDGGKLKDIKSMSDINTHSKTEESLYVIDTDDINKTLNLINLNFSDVKATITDEKIKLNASKETIAKICKLLVQNDLSIFEISTSIKTLEDEFIELTGSKQIR
ncbi:ABC transporter ATP-binding protein [uncultured Clostridium sp.]|jgi:ABC-2 type transport system ATP-binding protein|uniref:ABC transporter ATP-binding protein n=1 Tax=uncultured Clostridium sp. TaxID=59620 RepID=UPI00263839C0|nr:ABC transporter ATP-binding protein [uncultured Clostridium sp.]